MNERVTQTLAHAQRVYEAALAQNESQQVYEMGEDMRGVTELAQEMWQRIEALEAKVAALEPDAQRLREQVARTRQILTEWSRCCMEACSGAEECVVQALRALGLEEGSDG
jgi:chaperonin cofactor prefoldin